ncbi:alpha/beta hydrolase family protein [Runella limosa]|uniref:alpha/beta hydrolase family protein n=1 Tax=Runella limosa TaxID=370978 RepID=UPI0006859A71|nr:prolyl oligopeptidase family serine peptidase [Runella limosa]
MRKYVLLLFCGVISSSLIAQKKPKKTTPPPAPIAKKALTHDVYDFWKDIPERVVSNNGQWFGYALNPQEGDGKVVFQHFVTNQTDSVARGGELRFSNDSEFAVFKIKPQLSTTKTAKRAKKKKDEMPKDSLGIYALSTKKLSKFPAIQSFKLPEKGSEWVAYLGESPKVKPDTTKKAPTRRAKRESDENGYRLVTRILKTNTERAFGFVTDYEVSKNGKRLAFATSGSDSTKAGVYVFEPASNQLQQVYEGHSKHKFKKLSFDENGDQLAFIADLDTNSKAQIRLPKLFYWKAGQATAARLADETNQPAAQGWLVSGEYTPRFAKDGSKLFFGTNPKPIVQDTTLLTEEIVNVEVWHWQDERLQTQQKVSLERDKKQSYLAVAHLNDLKLTQLGSLEVPDVTLVNEGNADFVIGKSDRRYSHQHWDWNPVEDAYLISLRDGSKKMAKEKIEGSARTSPEGKYLYWFSNPDTAWFAHDIAANQTIQLTNNKTVKYADEEDDHPDFPNPYGIAGWTKNDQYLLVYDRFDIWQIDPKKPASFVKLTDGRAAKNQYRYVRLDAEERNIDLSKSLLLRTVNETTRQEGFSQLTGSAIQRLYEGDFKVGMAILKAKDADRVLFTKETFKEYPDWYATDLSFKNVKRVTEANAQQANYWWGSVEIVNWRAGDGTPLQGLLYKPENFDPTKKYPMMTYFYEKNSENIHTHYAPRPIRSYINFSYFTSNGYLVFVPDIVYKDGYPGQSAYNCIVPGVLSMIDKGFVDKDKIGISGHSWGGYQTAYLVTQTNLFRAAEAGAPVSNMTSAYGGIRWDSGMSRQAQYERTQSRIGGTLWEKPMQYLENSPLFHAPKIETPVLMMHNDDDGAVPWYQGIEFYMALKRLNKPVWMLNYNGEKHGLTKRQNMKDFAVRLYQYFDHYLKDAPAPEWMSEGLPMVEKGIRQGLSPVSSQKASQLGSGSQK